MAGSDLNPKIKRRTLITATSSVAAVGLAGCLGDDDDPDDGAAADGEDPGDDDGEEGGGGGNGEAEDVEQADWVVEADDAFGRIEPDYDAGEAAVEIRGEHISEPDEVAAIGVYDEDENEVAGSDFDAPEDSDVVDVPITSEAAREPIVGEVNVVIEDEFGDELHSSTWDLSPELEVVEMGMADDVGDFADTQFYVTIETSSPSAHISAGHLTVDEFTLDGENEIEFTDSPDDGGVIQDMDDHADNDLVLRHGESVVVTEYPRLQWISESDAEEECGVDSDGQLEFEVVGGSDVEVEFDVVTGSATESDDNPQRTTCSDVEIEISG